jgi:signal transduction histidine kinase
MNLEVHEMNRQPNPVELKMFPSNGAEDAICGLCAAVIEQSGESMAIGDEVRASQNELRRLSTQILTIQERERKRIATDLHDGLGQSLTLIKLGLEECSALLEANALWEVEESLQQLRLKIKDTFGELRRVAMNLRPSMLDDLGILSTLSWFFREFENACHGIKIERNFMVQESSVPVQLKISIFRILQEAICNIIKHSKADHICVSLMKVGNLLCLTIEDNGQGFDPAEMDNYCPHGKGLGLVSMKERANISGGSCRIDSAISKGTRIYVSWTCV